MLRRFWADNNGNYMMLTALAMAPLVGSVALAVDYSELVRQRAVMLSALDATGLATARRYEQGASRETLQTYAEQYFLANLNGLDFTKLTLTLPNDETGGGKLKVRGERFYDPYFIPAAYRIVGITDDPQVKLVAESEIRLKNTIEVALALDNSGSMSETGGSSGQVRMDLLKAAAKELVTQLGAQSAQMAQVEKPVQFSLVPFAASVNIGADKAGKAWMDQDGISPIHHENFDWTTMSTGTKRVELSGGIYYKKGSGWGSEENQKVTRFSMYNDVKRITGYTFVKTGSEWVCTKYSGGTCIQGYNKDVGYNQANYGAFAAWRGCVEARPSPYDVNDAPASTAEPATLFVPMYAPDEAGNSSAYNSWWPDLSESSSVATRQKYMPKYFEKSEQGAEAYRSSSDKTYIGPNQSCSTNAITPLTDVSTSSGATAIKNAIDAMQPNGATNVPEGMAWGWRTVSYAAPFSEGRPESERGNDKVVIVVTDGANTYYTPSSLGYSDNAGNKSIYSSLGYTKLINKPTVLARIFQNTSVNTTLYDNANYTTAMNQHFTQLCTNAKAKGIIVMTVALDLKSSVTAENQQMTMLKECASFSRIRKNADGTPAKLYWNSTGSSLSQDFKAIGDELSNLRIVS